MGRFLLSFFFSNKQILSVLVFTDIYILLACFYESMLLGFCFCTHCQPPISQDRFYLVVLEGGLNIFQQINFISFFSSEKQIMSHPLNNKMRF